MIQPGRKYSVSDNYRYGFNGKENDNEVKGEGNQQDYGMRIYDPRLGRFLSVDPLTRGFPSWSPYPFAMNRPVDGIDLDGLEFTKYWNRDEVSKRAKHLMTKPEEIRQVGGTCAIAAITYLWIKNDKEGFYKSVMGLYDNGRCNYGWYSISPDSHLENFDPNNPPKIDGLFFNEELKKKGADWIVISSLQDSENTFYDFEGMGGDDKGAGTNRKDERRLFKLLLGFDDIKEDFPEIIDPTEVFKDVQSKFKDGYDIMLTIDAKLVTGFPRDQKNYQGHAIIYLGNYFTSKNSKGVVSHTFDIQTWGTKRTISVNDEDFKKYYRGYMAGKKTKKEAVKKDADKKKDQK